MRISNIYEAKTQLSLLIELAIKGEDVIIARHGHPVVKLVPCESTKKPRQAGALRGKIKIADDFDELPEDLLKMFHGPLEP
ncbi:MAG: type II toxin-antitoxin system Phd/YefM family antitoxin [Gammaproteobacteria bacterium]